MPGLPEGHLLGRARRGAFSAGVTALAVAAVIFNPLTVQLPVAVTQFDMTDSGIYNITEATRTFLSGLEQDVEAHALRPEDQVDARIVRFLRSCEALSGRLAVKYMDPVAHRRCCPNTAPPGTWW